MGWDPRHAVVDAALVRRESLAAPRRADAIEAAIFEHRRVLLERFDAVGTFADSPDGELQVWPLQLIFHNVGWYLLYEEDQVRTTVERAGDHDAGVDHRELIGLRLKNSVPDWFLRGSLGAIAAS